MTGRVNLIWIWPEVGRLAFVHRTTWGGRTLLFAWPVPGYVPVADDDRRFRKPARVRQRAFRRDGWLIRARTWLTGIRRSRDGDELLREMKRRAEGELAVSSSS